MIRLVVLLSAIVAILMPTSEATACSTDFNHERYAQQIKSDPEVRKIKGTFSVDRITRDAEETASIEGKLFGRVVTAKGRTYSTVQTWSETAITCEINTKPLANAEGSFFISKRKKNGAFEMFLWQGRYENPNSEFEFPPFPREEEN